MGQASPASRPASSPGPVILCRPWRRSCAGFAPPLVRRGVLHWSSSSGRTCRSSGRMTTASRARDYGARMAIAERLRGRVRDLDQRWLDLALAAVVGLWFAVELLTRDPDGTDRLATAATGIAVIVALAWRTPRLGLACLVFGVAVFAQEPLDGGLMRYLDSSFAVLFALLYTAGRRTEG